MYKLKNRVKIKEATLNVKNINNMVDYYTNSIGLELISKEDNKAILGIGDNILLKLHEIDADINPKLTGLYHIAYLVPSRKDLANVLFSLIMKEVEIQGAADHGYSEAIYLTDPEGNGIEIYRDRDVSEWDIKDDGQIVGVTEALYADQLLSERNTDTPVNFSDGTIIGHIHLSIKDYNDTKKFYTDILGLDNKYEFTGQAAFLAANLYHHDIALNIWNSRGMELRQDNQLGLENFVILIDNSDDFEGLKTNFEDIKDHIININDREITIKDNQNIKITFVLEVK